MPRIFDESYQEQVTLRAGGVVSIRVLRASDRDLLQSAFERMSIRSRLRRFFFPKEELSSEELASLTQLDGETQFALVAGRVVPGGGDEGLGIARFVRDRAEPHAAEFAVTVVDAWHGRGLGYALLCRLSAAAQERGIEELRCSLLAGNAPMLHLLHKFTDVRIKTKSQDVDAHFPTSPRGLPKGSLGAPEQDA